MRVELDIFIARQPIFDRRDDVFAYELLFRMGRENRFPDVDGDSATSRLINYVTTGFNLKRLTSQKGAFVNITRRVLVEQLYSLLPPDRVVIELLETVKPDEDVVEACRQLREAGYALALDDYVDAPEYEPLLAYASFIKVDFLQTDTAERERLAEKFRKGTILLAEKVETREDVEEGIRLGYRYFQGYYFCKPKILSKKEIPASKLAYLEFFNEVFREEIDYERVEEIIRRDLSLAVKLIRMINSAAHGQKRNISSVREALIRLGEHPLQKWATILTLSKLADDQPRELIVTSLVRGRLCELIGGMAGPSAHSMFLVGMLSLLDVLLGRPLDEVIGELAVSGEVRSGILEDDSPGGRVLRLVVAHESADWETVGSLLEELGVSGDDVANAYTDAVVWANELVGNR